jgi:small-conductance mechanosensitive channel
MQQYQIQIIYTLIVLASAVGLRILFFQLVNKIRLNLENQHVRAKMIKKVIQLVLTILVLILLLGIWGVGRDQIMVFVSSIITIVGVAFVAQWSVLSNITATIILFINHPVKIGDSITILDKEFEITGTIKDIGIFFVTVKTNNRQLISVPSSIFMQKMIAKNFKKETDPKPDLDG